MKFVHIVPSLAEKHGGPSRSVRSLCYALAGTGHNVELLATDPKAPARAEEKTESDFKVRIFRRDCPGRLCPSQGLRNALSETDAAIVHHHSLWLRTLHYAAQANSRLVISPRGMMSAWAWNHHPWRKRFARWFVHPGALESARGWHATSMEEAQEIRALGFTQPICVAPNGVGIPSESERALAREHWRALCPESAQRPVALFYSRLHRKKRVLELIELWLRCTPPQWLLVIAGIPQEYRIEDLQLVVRHAHGSDRIRTFNSLGHPPPYSIASLFLLPSHNENFGLVIAEAMAHGVPVVVTDTTPWSEVTRHDFGWCVSWENYAEALAKAMAEGLPQLATRGARARDWVLREFSWEKSARTLSDFYAQLVMPRPAEHQ